MRKRASRLVLATIAGVLVVAPARVALAGPPLLCHPFDIGTAKSLPWGAGPGWNTPSRDYDVRRLIDDTLALLGPKTPVMVRMETLRRAAVYARDAGDVAATLLSRLRVRASEAERHGRPDPLAMFDVGYFVETYRQTRPAPMAALAGLVARWGVAELDGYALVQKAIELREGDAQMELAAAIMTAWPKRAARARHVEKAIAGGRRDGLLARNLIAQANNLDTTEADVRARLAASTP